MNHRRRRHRINVVLARMREPWARYQNRQCSLTVMVRSLNLASVQLRAMGSLLRYGLIDAREVRRREEYRREE